MNSQFRNWSDIRIFLAVLREGSTLAASKALGIAQPTVARRIDALEHELGLTLFERDTRGFRPTKAACDLRPDAEAIEAAIEAFDAKRLALTQTKPIRITAYTANFSPRITRIFSEFSLLNPDVEFDFLPSVWTLDLMAGEADIALRITHGTPDPALICRKISTAKFTVYGSPGYAKEHGLPTSPDDMRGHKFVTFRREGVATTQHDWITSKVAPEQIVRSFNEVETAIAAVRSGVGLGLDNLRRAADDPDLMPCFPPPPELDRDHMILINPEAWRRPEVKAFVKFFAPRYAEVFKDPPKVE